jgi:hypothetical protein
MRRPWAASAAITLCIAAVGMPTLAQEPSTEIGDGTGVLTVTVLDFPWEQFSGQELGGLVTAPSPEGFFEGVFLPVDGTIRAAIPGLSAQPGGVRQDPAAGSVGWSSSVTAQLQLDGQPVQLGPGVYTLWLTLGEADCFAGWNTTCEWVCRTSFDLRSDEDIWIAVGAVRVEPLIGVVGSLTCPVLNVAHHPPPEPPSEGRDGRVASGTVRPRHRRITLRGDR